VSSIYQPTQTSTIFKVFSPASSGAFVAELNLSGSGGVSGSTLGGWAGYLQSASAISSVSVNFTIPAITWTTPAPLGSSDDESLVIWAGIGGFDDSGTTNCTTGGCFWQAGVEEYKTSSTSPTTVVFFVEAPGDAP
jgi:hypothetical protein